MQAAETVKYIFRTIVFILAMNAMVFYFLPETFAAAPGADRVLQAARQGNAQAQMILANEYFFGKNRKANHTLAVYWFRQAAAQGDERAQYNLGICFERGWGVEKSERIACYWFKLAGKKLPEARLNYAEKLYYGVEGVSNNYGDFPEIKADQELAIGILRELHPKLPRAGIVLAKLLYKDAPKHAVELRKLLETHAKTAAPLPEGLVLYAACLRAGIGGPPDPSLGAKMLQKAAEADYPDALAQLAEILEIGSGLPPDPKRAAELTRRAAELKSPRGMVNLGLRHQIGQGVEIDQNKAFELFLDAAQNSYPPALYQLGNCYLHGIGTEKNEQLAFENYHSAAIAGNDAAQCALAKCFKFGIGTKKDAVGAFFWFEKAAGNGSVEAMYEAGKALISGKGITADPARGRDLLRKARQAGWRNEDDQ